MDTPQDTGTLSENVTDSGNAASVAVTPPQKTPEEIAQLQKMRAFAAKNPEILKNWLETHPGIAPPVYENQTTGELVWANRATRRQNEKLYRKMKKRLIARQQRQQAKQGAKNNAIE